MNRCTASGIIIKYCAGQLLLINENATEMTAL